MQERAAHYSNIAWFPERLTSVRDEKEYNARVDRELITTLVAIYAAVIGTLGFLVSLYSFRRDRRQLTLVVHPERFSAGDWGNHDCWYLTVSVVNTGRRPLALLDVQLIYFDTTMSRLILDALTKPPTFVQVHDGIYRQYIADRHENEIAEGLSARYFFEFSCKDDARPRGVIARDATLRTHTTYVDLNLLNFIAFALYRSFVFDTPPAKARRPIIGLLLLYEPCDFAKALHVVCFLSFMFLIVWLWPTPQPPPTEWFLSIAALLAVVTGGSWYLARKYDIEDPRWFARVLRSTSRDEAVGD